MRFKFKILAYEEVLDPEEWLPGDVLDECKDDDDIIQEMENTMSEWALDKVLDESLCDIEVIKDGH